MKNQEVDELIEQQREEIKGLMEWIAELEGTLDTAVSWDVEQLKVIHSLNEQNDQLRAELAAIKAQEPIYQFGIGEGSSSWNDISKRLYDGYVGRAEWATRVVYAAPVAKQVVMPEQKDSMDKIIPDWDNHFKEVFARLNAADQEGRT